MKTLQTAMNQRLTRRQALTLLGVGTAVPLWSSCESSEPDIQAAGPPAPTTNNGQTPLHYLSLREVARLIEARELSPVELTGMMLDRIATVDGRLKSYATVDARSGDGCRAGGGG